MTDRRPGSRPSVIERMAERSLGAVARAIVRGRLDVSVQGLEQLPPRGPVVLAARHYHHLHDAAILLTVVPRPVHVLVALDWVRGRRDRQIMTWACRTARWPTVLRADSPHLTGARAWSAYRPDESLGLARRAMQDVTRLIRDGRVLLVFPEAYPVIDPEGAHRPDEREILPFRPGFARMVARAQRTGCTRVPIMPVGLWYRPGERWRVTLRFGPPAFLAPEADRTAFVREIETRVRALSAACAESR